MSRNQRRPVLHALVLALIAFGVFSSVFVSKVFPLDLDHGPIAGLSLPSVGVSAPDVPVLTAGVLPDTIAREEFEDGLAVISGEAPEVETVAQTVAEEAAEAAPPLFQRYDAQEGDTAGGIAASFGITLQYLLWNNPELRDGDFLAVGDVLFIPVGNGILHYVSYGETLGGIAGFYGVEAGPIMAWAGNNVSSPDEIKDGELIFVPEGVPPTPAIPEPTAVPVAVQAPEPAPPPPPPPPTSAPTSNSGLSWPYSCQISRGFGGGHNGIDIDGICNNGAAIGAATSGTVISAVTATFNGYGRYVDVRSADGIVTRYAHLSSVHVSIGQQVSQGQSLGIIGATGNSTGIHLHFEVRINGSLVNPLSYLP